MNASTSGRELILSIMMAPFLAVIFSALGAMMYIIYQATHITGGGEFAQAQESVFSGSMTALNLIELASSIGTWILLGAFLLAIAGAASSMTRSGF